ncbi:MAG: ABC transporter ATP-binding protein [Armatimonadota bacterium]
MDRTVLEVTDLRVEFPVSDGVVRAVDGVSLSVAPGETLAVVGESGCGKTTLARAVLGLQPFVNGSISVLGEKVNGVSPGQAKRVGMVWQDPFASLDPRWTIRKQLEEPARIAGATVDVKALTNEVGLDEAFLDRYPHQLSGGQRQRVAIGRALALRPPLVICDEPTAALDLSVQAQILNLLKDLRDQTGSSFLYISHDLLTVRYLADRIAVMYMGQVVEEGPVEQVFTSPIHPYTRALIASSPSLENLGHLPETAKGEIPDPLKLPPGCRFATRCPLADDRCVAQVPPWTQGKIHRAFCWKPLSDSNLSDGSQ